MYQVTNNKMSISDAPYISHIGTLHDCLFYIGVMVSGTFDGWKQVTAEQATAKGYSITLA